MDKILTTNKLIKIHPHLSFGEAEDLLKFAQSKTIRHESCYGDGSIIYPKWVESKKQPEGLFNDFQSKLANVTSEATPEATQEADATQQQKTREWFKARLGMFTGSVMPDFMKNGRGGDIWGETCKKVIYRVVAERSMSPGGIESYLENMMKKEFLQTTWGNTYEDEARELFAKQSGLKVTETGTTKSEAMPYFSSSVDGLAGNTPVEIKCPFDPVKHEINLGQPDIIGTKSEYFWQMQSHLLITGAEYCFFVSYDPRRNEKEALKVMECHRDEDAINQLSDKLKMAELIVIERLQTGTYNFDV